MTYYIPDELHVGQKILVRPNPTESPMEAVVTYIDKLKGLVHVQFMTYNGHWAVKPRAISSLRGLYLHFNLNNKEFFFSTEPFFAG